MIDFISSIDNSYQRISIDSDPANRLNNNSKRTYSYDEAVADLNKAVALPGVRRGLLQPRQQPAGALRAAFPKPTRTTRRPSRLNPSFAEAYYNRGVIQIFMKDTRKGCLDLSKAGELGILEAYEGPQTLRTSRRLIQIT